MQGMQVNRPNITAPQRTISDVGLVVSLMFFSVRRSLLRTVRVEIIVIIALSVQSAAESSPQDALPWSAECRMSSAPMWPSQCARAVRNRNNCASSRPPIGKWQSTEKSGLVAVHYRSSASCVCVCVQAVDNILYTSDMRHYVHRTAWKPNAVIVWHFVRTVHLCLISLTYYERPQEEVRK